MKEPRFPYGKPSPHKFGLNDEATKWYKYSSNKGKEDVILYRRAEALFDDDGECSLCYHCERTSGDDDKSCKYCEDLDAGDDCSTLQDFLDLVPEGFTPADVTISYWWDDNPQTCGIVARYLKPLKLKEQKKKYAKAMAEWAPTEEKYDKEKKEYDEWKRETDIAEMQAKLKELEGQRNEEAG